MDDSGVKSKLNFFLPPFESGIMLPKGGIFMSFRENPAHQMNLLDDRFTSQSERTQKIILRSWAKPFAEHIFPKINEQRFAPLYSDNSSSRPNTPVNILVSLMLIQEMFQLTDDDIVVAVTCDIRFQYAIHTTSLLEQPISDRSLSRFRERNCLYFQKTGKDLIQEEIESLALVMCNVLDVNSSIFRMDSIMVEANCRKMSRMETLYTAIQKVVKNITIKEGVALPDNFTHYCETSDHNDLFYHSKATSTTDKLERLIEDTSTLLTYATTYGQLPKVIDSFGILATIFNQQTEISNGNRVWKNGKDCLPNQIQNPADTDATYREKQGDHIGYVGNMLETVDPNGKIIIVTDYQKNSYSDVQFCKDALDKLGEQEQPAKLITDGAYGSDEARKKASKLNIELITTNLVGKKTDSCKGQFVMNEDMNTITHCPMGQSPEKCSYWDHEGGTFRLTMEKEKCQDCPLRDRCGIKFQKRVATIQILKNTIHLARYKLLLLTPEYKAYARIRNGVEAIPSLLRRKYRVDCIPVHGLVRTKLRFFMKIGAINVKRMIKSLEIKAKLA